MGWQEWAASRHELDLKTIAEFRLKPFFMFRAVADALDSAFRATQISIAGFRSI